MQTSTLIIIIVSGVTVLILVAAAVLLVVWLMSRKKLIFSSAEINKYLEENVKLNKSPTQEELEKEVELAVHYYIRGTSYSLTSVFPGTWSRQGKFYWFIEDNFSNGKQGIMELLPSCSTTVSGSQRKLAKDCLAGLKNPLIAPANSDWLNDNKTMVVFREFYPKGSLRDVICNKDPRKKGYSKGKPSNINFIQHVGKHILEGLLLLHSFDWPYPHLHCGNVFIQNKNVLLSDVENVFLGLPPYHSDIIDNSKETSKNAAAEVLCFGCVLYELSSGQVLKNLDDIERLKSKLHPQIFVILKHIFYGDPTCCTLDDLIADPFFASGTKLEFVDKSEISKECKDFLVRLTKGETVANSGPRAIKRQKSASKAGREGTSVSRSVAASSSVSASTPLLSTSSVPPSPVISRSVSRPPPPPAPRAPVSAPSSQNVSLPVVSSDRNNLLESIRKGKTLKKTKSKNDRSAPALNKN